MLKCRRNEIKQLSQKMIVFGVFFCLAESILLLLVVDSQVVEVISCHKGY